MDYMQDMHGIADLLLRTVSGRCADALGEPPPLSRLCREDAAAM
jgi:hypothetical protein